jgi:hypothetical protein
MTKPLSRTTIAKNRVLKRAGELPIVTVAKPVAPPTPEQLLAKTISNAERDRHLQFYNPPISENRDNYIATWFRFVIPPK